VNCSIEPGAQGKLRCLLPGLLSASEKQVVRTASQKLKVSSQSLMGARLAARKRGIRMMKNRMKKEFRIGASAARERGGWRAAPRKGRDVER
jgi:hypothetical protein